MAEKEIEVLVVDDERTICDLLDDALTEWGYKCTTAINGRRALQELEKKRFDVILLDIRLPGMSGMDVLQEIWLHHADTPAIMITGVDDVDTSVQAMKMGASDYIVKPLDLDKLAASIETALKAKQAVPKTSPEMEAIARGVEVRLDPSFNYWRAVTQSTTEIARRLGVAEEEIQQWVISKTEVDSEKSKLVDSVEDESE